VLYANRAYQLIRLGRPAEAEQAARKSLALNPGSSYAQSTLAIAQLLQERPGAALETTRAIENDAARLLLLALAHYDRGDAQAADDALATLREQHARDAAYYIAVAHAWRHETEDAFAWLNRAIDEDQSVFGIRTEPFLRTLHDDPRWDRTLERTGLADHQIADIQL
jgi:tetratricopeptide (TPR) repeat protein